MKNNNTIKIENATYLIRREFGKSYTIKDLIKNQITKDKV